MQFSDSNQKERRQGALASFRAILLTLIAIALSAVALTRGIQGKENEKGEDEHGDGRSYAIGLWGDLPYSDVQAQSGVPNLIADMNKQDLEFTAHDGDLKAGSGVVSVTPTTCSDALDAQALGYFNALKAPVIFTPGDNDWTDCDRPANGSFNSLERLDHERRLFFSTPFSLGQHKIKQEVQSVPLCKGFVVGTAAATTTYKDVPCVENRRWIVGRVVFATINIQGSCNNLCDTFPDPTEYMARNIANIAWMQDTFMEAKQRNAVAVMFITQADPGWDLTDGTRAPVRDPKTLVETDANPDGFKDFLVALREQVIAFRKPVAYVNGDSHYFRIDKPFLDSTGTTGRRLENFTRIETFGDHQENGNNDVHWLKVIVDPESREVFSYQTQIVPANRTAVPAP